MSRQTRIQPEFVAFAPDVLAPGMLYVSMAYATVLHACCCGCGNKVVTPLAPGRWRLMYDGKSISLDPSVGNWSFPCQSHYWIERNAVVWDRRFNHGEIAATRDADRRDMVRVTPRAVERGQRATRAVRLGVLAHAVTDWWHRLFGRPGQ